MNIEQYSVHYTKTVTSLKVRDIPPAAYSGIYSIPDAALYLRATTPPPQIPLALWEKRRNRFIKPTSRHLHAWIRRSRQLSYVSDDPYLNFAELVRMRMIVILRSRGFSLQKIEDDENYLRRLTGSSQPFITESLWSSGSDLFVQLENLLSASRRGQLAMDFLKDYLNPVHHGLRFDQYGISKAWLPMPGVLVDPDIQFGAPCILGTRIETEAIWSFHKAGTDREVLAELYEVELKDIDAALAWEKTLDQAA